MKSILLAFFAIISSVVASAQSYEGSIEYNKKNQKAMVIDFPYAPSVVEDAIVSKMESLGHKKKESKGFLVYKAAVLNDISPDAADYMIKVERKSRREKDESVVYILMNRADGDVIALSEGSVNSNIKSFLNGLAPNVEALNLEREIQSQEEIVTKAEKKLRDLKDDKESMEKKIQKLEEDIKDNEKNQENQQKTIETQKLTLEGMKAKRKSA